MKIKIEVKEQYKSIAGGYRIMQDVETITDKGSRIHFIYKKLGVRHNYTIDKKMIKRLWFLKDE